MTAYIVRRTSLHDPDRLRDHAGIVRRGAVRAGRAGRTRHRPAVRKRHRGDLAHFRLGRRRLRRARGDAAGRPARRQRQVSRRAGARSRIHQKPREAVRLRQAGLRALFSHALELPALRLRQELLPRRERAGADQGETAGFDLARYLDDAAELSDLDPARHPQGGARRLAIRRVDLRRHYRRLCHPWISVRDSTHHSVRRRLVL